MRDVGKPAPWRDNLPCHAAERPTRAVYARCSFHCGRPRAFTARARLPEALLKAAPKALRGTVMQALVQFLEVEYDTEVIEALIISPAPASWQHFIFRSMESITEPCFSISSSSFRRSLSNTQCLVLNEMLVTILAVLCHFQVTTARMWSLQILT
jgi:hypothetical protein